MSQTKKKILFHLPVPLRPCDTGNKRRILGVLKYFRDRREFFAVDAVASNEFGSNIWTLEQKQEALNFVDNLFIYKGEHNLFDFLYSRSKSFYHQKLLRQQLPVDSDYFTPPGYVNFVQSLISQRAYDFIWVNRVSCARLALSSKSTSIHTVIDMHDLDCDLRVARKNILFLKKLKFDYEFTLNQEIKLLNKFDTVICCSQYEMAFITPHLSSDKLYLIPHIVKDLNAASNMVSYSCREFKYDLLFVGTAYLPNIDGISFFLNSIFPNVVFHKPDVKLAIAGTVAQSVKIDACLEQNVARLGYVPALSDLYLKSRLVICPLLDGSGTKVKLLEAMAYAIPIVTTQKGASGLSLMDGVNAFITDDSTLYAKQILRLLKEPELAQKLSEEVAMTFEDEYSNSVIYSKLDEVFGIFPSQT